MPTYRIDAFTATDRGTVIASFSGCSRKTAWQSEKQSDQAGPRSRRAAISLSYPLGPAPSAREGPAWDRLLVRLHASSYTKQAPQKPQDVRQPAPATPRLRGRKRPHGQTLS